MWVPSLHVSAAARLICAFLHSSGVVTARLVTSIELWTVFSQAISFRLHQILQIDMAINCYCCGVWFNSTSKTASLKPSALSRWGCIICNNPSSCKTSFAAVHSKKSMSFSLTMNTFLYYPQDSLHSVIVGRFHRVHSVSTMQPHYLISVLNMPKRNFQNFLCISVAGTWLIRHLHTIELLHDQ